MKFFDYSEAERREWRESDITKAFIDALTERAVEFEQAALLDLRSGPSSRAPQDAVHASGLRDAAWIAIKESK